MRCGYSRLERSRATRRSIRTASNRSPDARSAGEWTASLWRSSSRQRRSARFGIENLRERLSKRVALLVARSARPARTAADPPRHAHVEHRSLSGGRTHAVRAAGVFSGGGKCGRCAGRVRRDAPNRLALSLPTACFESPTRAVRCASRCSRRFATTPSSCLLVQLLWDEARNAHAEYFANLIEHIEPKGEGTSLRLRLIDLDIDNFRAAMDWFGRNGEDGAALQLATGLYHYWYLRGLLREGRSRLGAPLGRGAGSPALRALALRALAGLELVLGDSDSAEERARAGIATGTQAGTLEPVMGCETVLGLAALGRGRLDEARTHIARSGALATRARARSRHRDCGHQPGRDLVSSERPRRCAAPLGKRSRLARAALGAGEQRVCTARTGRGRQRRRQPRRGWTIVRESALLAETVGFAQLVGHANIGLAAVAAKSRNYVEAAGQLGRANAIFDEFGGPSAEFDPALATDAEASVRAALGENAFTSANEAGRRWALEHTAG